MGESLGGDCYSDAKHLVLRRHLKESNDGETPISVGISFQICGVTEKKARSKVDFH